MVLAERIIEYLTANPEGYASGQKLADEMGVTRAAVWKTVEALRAGGYGIDSVRAKGYRLASAPDRLTGLEISSSLDTRFVGRTVYAYAETGSTNREAMRLASDGAPDGTLVVADRQAEGRGRLGRKWESPPGLNIYASVIFRPDLPPASVPLITLGTSVAIARAVKTHNGIDVRIKWPNDILTDGRKLAGILTEMNSGPDRVRHVVVGFGVNVNSMPGDFPPDVRKTAASIRSAAGAETARAGLLARILGELERSYSNLTAGARDGVLDEWREFSDTIGRRVRVSLYEGEITGRAVDVDSSGALIVRRDNGEELTVLSGDVVHLR